MIDFSFSLQSTPRCRCVLTTTSTPARSKACSLSGTSRGPCRPPPGHSSVMPLSTSTRASGWSMTWTQTGQRSPSTSNSATSSGVIVGGGNSPHLATCPRRAYPDDCCCSGVGPGACQLKLVIVAIGENDRVALRRMDNVGIVVESLDAAISFFAELGLELEGRAMIEGDWSGRVTGLRDQRVEIAMMRMPDGHGRIELSRFLAPPIVADHRDAPVNALGYLRVMFAVDDLDDTLARLRRHGARLVDEVVEYEDLYRLCYVRGPEGILIGLAEQIG